MVKNFGLDHWQSIEETNPRRRFRKSRSESWNEHYLAMSSCNSRVSLGFNFFICKNRQDSICFPYPETLELVYQMEQYIWKYFVNYKAYTPKSLFFIRLILFFFYQTMFSLRSDKQVLVFFHFAQISFLLVKILFLIRIKKNEYYYSFISKSHRNYSVIYIEGILLSDSIFISRLVLATILSFAFGRRDNRSLKSLDRCPESYS